MVSNREYITLTGRRGKGDIHLSTISGLVERMLYNRTEPLKEKG